MNKDECDKRTCELLTGHCRAYPKLQIQDLFKYVYQSSLGCEHSVSDEEAALEYIIREYETVTKAEPPIVEELDGEYCRVDLSCIGMGLSARTLARLFCLSAKKEPDGYVRLEQKLEAAKTLIAGGELHFDINAFESGVDEWRESGYGAVGHSDVFRREYRPTYRVIAKRYAELLPVFAEIDRLSAKGSLIVAIEGGSASGKTTLATLLRQVYGCHVFHMDDFFLRPEQRTPERFAEVGGNVDRERFYNEVLEPLIKNETVCYRPFDCSTQTLRESITVAPCRLAIVEGAYSMHPAFDKYYGFSIFLDISAEYQRERIYGRNPELAERFFDEWIPLENRYFSCTDAKGRADFILYSAK